MQDGAASANNVRDAVAFAEAGKWKVDVVSYVVVQENPGEVFAEYRSTTAVTTTVIGLAAVRLCWTARRRAVPRGSRPYEGETEYRGYPVFRDDEVDAYVRACVENGRQLLAHLQQGTRRRTSSCMRTGGPSSVPKTQTVWRCVL